MTYKTRKGRAELLQWIREASQQIAVKTTPGCVRKWLDREDSELIAELAMVNMADGGTTERALLYHAGRCAVARAVQRLSPPRDLLPPLSLSDSEAGRIDPKDSRDGIAEVLTEIMREELLDSLPHLHRQVMRDLLIDGKSMEEITTSLGRTRRRVEQLKAESLTLLRLALEDK